MGHVRIKIKSLDKCYVPFKTEILEKDLWMFNVCSLEPVCCLEKG